MTWRPCYDFGDSKYVDDGRDCNIIKKPRILQPS